MQYTLALMALAAGVASAQGVTSVLTPTASAPAGCSTSYSGSFEITVVLPPKTSKRDVIPLEKRQSTTCSSDGTLVATLKNGILTDSKGRIGEIVANRQFQFDGPPAQAGSIYTGGWSVCNNGSLAIGGQAIFYQCLSGTFYNLYDQSQGGQCNQVLIDIIPCTTGGSAPASGAGQGSDGQPTAASATAVVSQKTDGQPNAASATAVASQIADGQVQASSAVYKPVSQFTDGQLQVTASPAPAVTQISDGQIQATKATAVASVKPVSQISDGQVQATKATTAPAAPVSQISDGQIQATTAAPAKPTATLAPVSQISDGQVQATAASNATKPAASPSVFTGAAAPTMVAGAQLVAGAAAAAVFALL